MLGGVGYGQYAIFQWCYSVDFIFIFFVQDWEVDLVLAFFGVLYSLRWRQGGED
jgi:hypothetical protein